jgi:phosphoglycolate phosphatase
MTRYSLAVFDFDGTLVDSEACIRQSIEQALADHGMPTSLSVLKEWIGLPLATIIRSACGDADAARVASIISAYRVHYAALDPAMTFPFPGIPELLQQLTAAGVRLALATNKHTTPARATLDRLDHAHYFAAIVGADQVAKPKPEPDILLRVLEITGIPAHETLMIGDATVDLQMAAAAGVASCAVTWGNQDREPLEAAQPTYVVSSPAALARVITGEAP